MKETLNFIHVKNLRDVLIKNHIKCFFFASFSILVKRYFKKGLIIFIPMLKKQMQTQFILNQEFKILPCRVKL